MIKTTTNREIVTAAYKGMLNREPDQHGLNIYTYLLDKGDTVESLLEKFVASEEFKNLHRSDNGISGDAIADNAIFDDSIFDNAFYDNGITVENAKDWIGFGRGEIEYIKAWQDKTLEGTPGFSPTSSACVPGSKTCGRHALFSTDTSTACRSRWIITPISSNMSGRCVRWMPPRGLSRSWNWVPEWGRGR